MTLLKLLNSGASINGQETLPARQNRRTTGHGGFRFSAAGYDRDRGL